MKIDVRRYPRAMTRFYKFLGRELPRAIIDDFMEEIRENMEHFLSRFKREYTPEEGHFSESLEYVRTYGARFGGAIRSRYPRKPALIALALERGRRGYERRPPKGPIFFRKGHAEREKGPGEKVFTRKVRAARPRKFITPALRLSWRKIPPKIFKRISKQLE